MKKALNIALLAAIALSSAACEEWREVDSSSENISFDVASLVAPKVKSASDEGVIIKEVMKSEGNVPIVALNEVTDMDVAEQEVVTRASRYNSESEFAAASQTFKIWGWNVSDSYSDIYTNATVTKTGGKWIPAGGKKWKNNTEYCFEAVYPNSTGFSSFTISSADPAGVQFSYELPANAGAADDYMLAYYKGLGDKGKATLVFTHPFTCVKFAAGEGVTVNSVKLTGLYSKGLCQVAKNTSSNPGDYYTYTWNSLTKGHEITTSVGTELLLIPQNLASDNVGLEVSLTVDGITFNSTATLSTGNWEAGKVNTYTFTINEGVSVQVTDSVADKLKSNVKIQNTGVSKAYIRAAIVAGWYDENEIMVAAWDETSGTFTDKLGSKWVKVGDYYYYQDPVEAGEKTGSDLFGTYTAPAAAPVAGAHLEMTILTQAVIWDADKARVKAAWGDSISSSLN